MLREFFVDIDPRLGTDLTTGELLARMVTLRPMDGEAGRLREVLDHADAVKFARHRPSPEEVNAFWRDVHRSVNEFAPMDTAREEVPA